MEFGSDGTPLYVAVPGGSLENQGDHFIFKRSLKEAKMGGDIKAGAEDDSDKSGGEPIGRAHPIFKRSLILNSTSRVAGSIDQEYLEQIVNDFNRSLTHDEAGEEASVNFDDPIDVADLPLFHNEDLDHLRTWKETSTILTTSPSILISSMTNQLPGLLLLKEPFV